MMVSRVNILGIGISAINMAMALQTIEGWISQRESHYICVTGVHGVMESQHDVELRRIHNAAGLVTPAWQALMAYQSARARGSESCTGASTSSRAARRCGSRWPTRGRVSRSLRRHCTTSSTAG